MIEDEFKFLVLGYRVHTGKTQRELAEELGVPLDIVMAMEEGTYRYPTKKLMRKINELTGEYEVNRRLFINTGKGYRLRERLGSQFRYFVRGLDRMKYISQEDLKNMPEPECYSTIGSVDLDAFEVLKAGKMS
ncbi:MAG: hypothetical protein NQU45_05860 [Methanothermobacter sp.]|uniref:hypothetical protein n=1 Tax=Methanothermobacter thermautotrophicus TaxID=145262 RepID=UPI001D015E42|nr:hypothetical protein [Methanothermobacter thermautotrophicus]MCQ8905217.1 hypothetical protein [Methanothermobacter sp.]